MKQTIQQLRERWYGSEFVAAGESTALKTVRPVACQSLVSKSIGMMNSKFIPLCHNYGLGGVIGALQENELENNDDNAWDVQYPIDLLIDNLGLVVGEQLMEEEGNAHDDFSANLGEDQELA